jgi:methylene-fatty-acyl-phospholipid synthase
VNDIEEDSVCIRTDYFTAIVYPTIMPALGFYKNPYYVSGVADFSQPSFWVAAAAIIFNPLYWNIVAQNEYRRKTITRFLGNRPYYGCYALGASIFLLGIIRDHL